MNLKNKILIAGSSGGGGSSSAPYEEPDTLQSSSQVSVVDLIGEGQIGGLVDGERSIFLDGTPLQGKSGNQNFEKVAWAERTGTQNQEIITGFGAIETPFPLGTPLKSGTPKVFILSGAFVDEVRIVIAIAQLMLIEDDGDRRGTSVDIGIALSLNDGPYIDISAHSIQGKTSSRYQRSYNVVLPKTTAEGNVVTRYGVQVRRITPESTSSNVINDIVIDSYTEIVNKKLNYPNSALMAVRFDSEAFSSMPKREYLVNGLLIKVPSNYDAVTRTYSGVWDGSFKLAALSNPAWILYDLLLSRRYGLGEYLDVTMIDEAKLYQVGQYCDQLVDDGFGKKEPRYTINCAINNRVEAYDLIVDICSAFNGMAYWSGDCVSFTIDAPSDPVALFTPANIIGEFGYSGSSLKDRHSIATVTWNDPEDGYKQAVECVEDAELIERYGVRKIDIQAFGCTSRGQAHRIGRWMLYTEHQQSEMIVFKTGLDASMYLPGDLVQIQDPDRSGARFGGRLLDCSTTQATLDTALDFTGLTSLKISMPLSDGEYVQREILAHSTAEITLPGTSIKRTVTTVIFEEPLVQLPVDNGVWAISSPELQLVLARIVNIKQGENKTENELTVIPHNPSKYLAIESDMMLEIPKTSLLNSRHQEAPPSVTLGEEIIEDQGITKSRLIISWTAAKDASKYSAEWKRDGGNWMPLPSTANLSLEVDDVYSGIYTARVMATNLFGASSYFTYSVSADLNGKIGAPDNLFSFTATPLLFGIELNWQYPAKSANVSHVEIEYFDGETSSTWLKLGAFAYPTTSNTITGLHGNLKRTFRTKVVDKNGNESAWSNSVSVVVSADPEQLLEILEGHVGLSAITEELVKDIADGALAKEIADNAAQAAAHANQVAADAQGNAAAAAELAHNAAISADDAVTKAQQATYNASEAAYKADTASSMAQGAIAMADQAAADASTANELANAAIVQGNQLGNLIVEINGDLSTKIQDANDGVSRIETDYKDADNAIAQSLATYKASNDTALAGVVNDVQTAVTASNANASAITGLQAELTNVTDTVNTKANASALTSLENRVIAEEAKSVSQGQQLTSLDNKINQTSDALSLKANASAVTALENRVTAEESKSQSQSASITTLNNSLTAVKTTADGAIPFVSAAVDNVRLFEQVLRYRHNIGTYSGRYVIRTPITYTNYMFRIIIKGFNNVVGSSSVDIELSGYASRTAGAVMNGGVVNKGSHPIAARYAESDSKLVIILDGGRYFSNLQITADAQIGFNSPPTTWKDGWSVTPMTEAALIADATIINIQTPIVYDVISSAQATATALTTLTSDVTNDRGTLTSHSASITNLQNSLNQLTTDVSTKATAEALSVLTSEVIQNEDELRSQSSSITSLQNSVGQLTLDVNTKASSAALDSLTSDVINNSDTLTAQSASITNLNNELDQLSVAMNSKATSSALESLASTVSENENTLTSQGASITNLNNEIDQLGLDVATKASAAALTSLVSEVTRNKEAIESQSASVTSLSNTLTAVKTTADGALPLVSSQSNKRRLFRDVLRYVHSTTSSYKALYVIETPVTFAGYMFNLIIRGYNNAAGATDISLNAGGYATSGSVQVMFGGVTNKGSVPITVRYAQKDGKLLVILFCPLQNGFSNTQITVDAEIGYKDSPASWKDGWSIVTMTETELTSNTAITGIVSPQSYDVIVEAKGTSAALTSLTSSVTNDRGVLTSQGAFIVDLQNSVSTLAGNVSTKASIDSVAALTNRVTESEGELVAQANDTVQLTNRIITVEGDLTEKADASALTSLSNRVEVTEQKTTSQADQLTSLNSSVAQIGNQLSTKADASALANMYTKAETEEKATTIASGAVSQFKANLNIGGTNLLRNSDFTKPLGVDNWQSNGASLHIEDNIFYGKIAVTQMPSGMVHDWVKLETNKEYTYSAIIWQEIGTPMDAAAPLHYWGGVNNQHQSKVAVTAFSHSWIPAQQWTRVWVTFKLIDGADSFKPFFYGNNAGQLLVGRVKLEIGNVATDWSPNPKETAESLNANAGAIQTTNTEVTRINGELASNAASINQLNSTVTGLSNSKADASALTSLTTRVTNAEGVNTSQGTSITSLQGSITTTNNNVSAAQTAAQNALTKANEKGKVIFSSTAPTVDNRLSQNLWIDTTNNTNTPKRWNGTAWVVVTDKVATDALAAANAAQTTANTKADAAALTSLSQTVASTNDRVTANASAITNLRADLTTGLNAKLNASVISSYYTKAETSAEAERVANLIASGKVEEYRATLNIGGANLLNKSNSFRLGNGGVSSSVREILADGSLKLNGNLDTWFNWDNAETQSSDMTSLKAGDEITLTLWVKAVDAADPPTAYPSFYLDGLNPVYSSVGFKTVGDISKGGYVKYVQTRTVTIANPSSLGVTHTHWTAPALNGGVIIGRWQIEKGNVSTDWSPSIQDTSSAIAANATAIRNTEARVIEQDGRLSTVASDTVILTSKVNSIEFNAVTSKKVDIDLRDSRFGRDTWYPVGIGALPTTQPSRMAVYATLDNVNGGDSRPHWVTHGGGFSLNFVWEAVGAGWGTSIPNRRIHNHSWSWTTGESPVQQVDQFSESSREVVWLRGGVRYMADIPKEAFIFYPNGAGNAESGYGGTAAPLAYDANRTPRPEFEINAQTAVTLEQKSQVIDGMSASYTVKINNNGYSTGFGLISTGSNGPPSSAFKVDADAFEVGKLGLGIKPFVVITSANQTINGITYPAAGTYIHSAYIANSTIKMAHIDKASITSLSSLSANIGTLTSTAPDGTVTQLTGNGLKITAPNGVVVVEIGNNF